MQTYAIILAAGQGTRMKSKLYKVLHSVCGIPMVQHVLNQVQQVQADLIVTIIGHGAADVKSVLGDASLFALQEEQLGTAHAVKQAKQELSGKEGITFVICGDTPLITGDTMRQLREAHIKQNAKATILTAVADNPTGYGRIIRNDLGLVEKIVEHKDASEEERKVQEINTGTYCFDNQLLFSYLEKVKNENVQGEYYLPDVIELMKKDGLTVAAYTTSDFSETLGVNDRVALAEAELLMQARILTEHMKNGVTIQNLADTKIEAGVEIGQDTVIKPGCVLATGTKIGTDCVIGPNTEISNCVVGDGAVIRHSACYDSEIGSDIQIGPFAHIRPKSKLGNRVKIGNFVEVKATTIGDESKVSHLSYIGDSEVGQDVNIGCGSITVNYDGKNKFKTVIGDGSFIGCNSNLVAPVSVGKGAFVAAGSTIVTDVPDRALSIARAKQVDKLDYMDKKLK